jgi:hypothetical protein
MLRDKRIWILAAYLFSAVYLLPMYPHGGSANELTRWATAVSIIEKGSFEISRTESLIGPNVDTAKVGDRTFSNKAPGPALVSAPFYAITRLFIGPPDASNIRISWFVMRFATSTLPLFLLAFWMFRRGADAFSLAALLFATPLFAYSLLYFSHVLAAVAVYAAYRLSFDDDKGKRNHLIAAGFLSGLAVISEFPAIFPVAVFCVGLLLRDKGERFRPLLYFVVGGLPFAIFLSAYNNAIFGSPFSMSYAHESFPEWAEVAGQGFFGIGMPTPANIYLLLISPARGLLFTSPLLALPIALFIRRFDRTNVRNVVRVAAALLGFLIICGHGAAHGGWAFGPRYLVLIVPFLLDPFFEGEIADLSPALMGSLLSASVLLCVSPVLTFPFAPPEFTFPHNQMWMTYLAGEGWFVPNLANVLGAPSSAATLLPVVVSIVIVVCAAAAASKAIRQFSAGIAVAVVVFAVYVLVPADRPEIAFRRAAIAERYFRPAGRMDRFAADARGRSDWAQLRRVNDFYMAIADTRAYAPNDFPYLPAAPLPPSPKALEKAALKAQSQSNFAEAERLLQTGKQAFPFAKCDFSTNLAVIDFTTNRKDAALKELESVQDQVDPASRAGCMKSQFLLATLYKELGRDEDARGTAQRFMTNSANSTDEKILGFRSQLAGK